MIPETMALDLKSNVKKQLPKSKLPMESGAEYLRRDLALLLIKMPFTC
jgi:hypothetical protein